MELLLAIILAIQADTITLKVERPNGYARLYWEDSGGPPYIYKVYKSATPTDLGTKLTTTSSLEYYDAITDDTLYFYQVVKVTG